MPRIDIRKGSGVFPDIRSRSDESAFLIRDCWPKGAIRDAECFRVIKVVLLHSLSIGFGLTAQSKSMSN